MIKARKGLGFVSSKEANVKHDIQPVIQSQMYAEVEGGVNRGRQMLKLN